MKQHVGKLKTEASEKPIPLSPLLISELLEWRKLTPYAKDADYVFASPKKKGLQPLWLARVMSHHIQPVAAKIVPGKRITWHTLRRTYATLLQGNNDDPKVVQELLRHASVAMTMNIYAQAVTEKKRNAQCQVLDMVAASQKAQQAQHGTGKEKDSSATIH